jgi:hypothetical protein
MKYIALLLYGLILAGCTRADLDLSGPLLKPSEPDAPESLSDDTGARNELGDILMAELKSPAPARKVLKTGRKLALEEKAIIRGSCWNWINTVFKRAGYAENNHIVFKSKKRGPYAKPGLIKPGDWLYYVNHSYNRIEHSGIFVHWVDYRKKIGMVLSYGGEGRRKPGRYKAYNLKDVYFIKRPGSPTADEQVAQSP